MLLDFSKIKLREDGTPERPILRLQTLYGKTLGVIANAYNLEITINYSSLSEISFDVARWSDGVENPIYDQITGYKLVYTDALGIYVIQRPETTGDGMSEVKHVTGYSLEQLREGKLLYLEEGTYNFWNPVDTENTILSRILELFPEDWSVGEVDPRFVGMYRTFDSYNEDVLKFCYNDASEKFLCVFVFDVYGKTINVYSSEDSRGTLPIYLGYENLVKETKVTELSDEIVTKLHVYGDDGLTITACNPLGTDYIIDLSHYVENGDLDYIAPPDGTMNLGEKYMLWKAEVEAQRENFLALSSARANALAQELALEVELAALNEEYETLRVQQGAKVQEHALASEDPVGGDESKQDKQDQLDTINNQMAAKEEEIKSKQTEIDDAKAIMDTYQTQMQNISQSLSLSTYFKDCERKILEEYLQEQELSEETFVATDIATDTNGSSGYFTGSVSISPVQGVCKIYRLNVTEPSAKTLYSIAGGVFSAKNSGNKTISGDIVRGTLEVNGESSVLSLYLCGVIYEQVGKTDTYESGMLTVRGKVSGLTSDITTQIEDGVELQIGSTLSFSMSPATVDPFSASTQYYFDSNKKPNMCMRSGKYYRCVKDTIGAWNDTDWMQTEQYNLFMSASVTAYQRYSVARELYDYGAEALHDMATPTYEFDLEASNFIFLNEFKAFKDILDMGKAVYVKLRQSGEAERKQGRGDIIEANLIGLSFSYEDLPRLSLTFSNRFKKRNGVKTLEGMIKNSYSSTRSFDTSRYVYGKVTEHAGEVEEAMKSSLNVAKNKILSAHDQSVEISDSGIHISSFSETPSNGHQYELRIIDSMIAMTDDGWQTAKLAIGRFDGGECHWDNGAGGLEPGKTGALWGVNADVIFGKQLVGQSMIIESRGDNIDGENEIKQFKFDASGAWMNNATLTVQNNSSRISIDPTYGIIGGTPDVFSAEGTSVTYNFLEDQSDPDSIKRDQYGIPSLGSTKSGGYYEHTEDVKFFLDLKTGSAYFNGTIYSKNGFIGGWTIDDGKLYAGDGVGYVRLNPGVEEYGEYAIWCGANNPVDAPFWVKKNGDMKAKNGMFTGQFIATGRGALAEDAPIVGGEPDIEQLPDINNNSEVPNETSAFYIFDTTPVQEEQDTWKEATYRDLVGFIAFDENGSGPDGTNPEATDRVIFRTTSKKRKTNDGDDYYGVPIKIQSGGDMSLECMPSPDAGAPDHKIYIMSPTSFHGAVEMNNNTLNVSTIQKSSASASSAINFESDVDIKTHSLNISSIEKSTASINQYININADFDFGTHYIDGGLIPDSSNTWHQIYDLVDKIITLWNAYNDESSGS